MIDSASWLFILVQLFFVDLLLGADNAIVIALALQVMMQLIPHPGHVVVQLGVDAGALDSDAERMRADGATVINIAVDGKLLRGESAGLRERHAGWRAAASRRPQSPPSQAGPHGRQSRGTTRRDSAWFKSQ